MRWWAVVAVVAGCGGGSSAPDAALPDARVPIPDARPVADAWSAGDAAPLPDGGPLAACAAETSGPAAPVALADRATTSSSLEIPFRGDGRVRKVSVTVDVEHPYPRDLTLALVSPGGTEVVLSSHRGTGDGYRNTVFSDDALEPIAAGSGSYWGPFRPEQPLSRFASVGSAGTWTLRVTDATAGDVGRLLGWSVRVDACIPQDCVARTIVSSGETRYDPDGTRTYLGVELDPYISVIAARLGLSLTYTFDEDVRLALWSPAATRIELSSGNGGLGANYTETLFDDDAPDAIVDGVAPFTGRFRPEEPLERVRGEAARGLWILETKIPLFDTTGSFSLVAASLELDVCELPCPIGTSPVRVRAVDGATTLAVGASGKVAALAVRVSGEAPAGVSLVAPSGSSVSLGDGSFAGALFVDAAASVPGDGDEPTRGAVRPAQPLAGLGGQVAAGAWRVTATDGTFTELELELCVQP